MVSQIKAYSNNIQRNWSVLFNSYRADACKCNKRSR